MIFRRQRRQRIRGCSSEVRGVGHGWSLLGRSGFGMRALVCFRPYRVTIDIPLLPVCPDFLSRSFTRRYNASGRTLEK